MEVIGSHHHLGHHLCLLLVLFAGIASSSTSSQLEYQPPRVRNWVASTTLSRAQDSTTPVDGSPKDQVLKCDESLWDMIVTQTKITRSKIDSFKQTYAQAKFSLSWELLDSFFDPSHDHEYLKVCDEEQCSQVLPTLPAPVPATPTDHLTEVSGYVKRYTIALEQLFLDQSLNEDQFLEEMDELHRHMELLALVMDEGLESCQLAFDNSVLGELAGKMYTHTDPLIRDQRGFVTIRQCLLGLTYTLDQLSDRNNNGSGLEP